MSHSTESRSCSFGIVINLHILKKIVFILIYKLCMQIHIKITRCTKSFLRRKRILNFNHQIKSSFILGLFLLSGALRFIEILIQSQFVFVASVLV